jgi:fumarate reductase subunit C
MRAKTETQLWLAQRVSAAVLAVTVSVHIATVIYAVRDGLSAAEIIARLQGNVGWLVFYLVFVVAAAVHAPLGMRTILAEMTPLRGWPLTIAAIAFGVVLAALGARAVFTLFNFAGL